MFSGAYAHSVDGKGRTVVPVRFRARLGERFYITKGMHGCLWVLSDEQWREFQQALAPKSLLDSRALKLERFFVGSAVECLPDGQGRILIPQNLRDYAGIDGDIWIVGLTNKLEIWSSERWEALNEDLTDERIQQIGEELELS